ncbi:MAG: FeoB-associated Cys-rich membrane protein [Prevotella sp.]|nr:FeoB-associated Cys-rich membrane protein [Alistipes senegalensis]MCM1358139.1 FeoB-associated Cys-rich membrane protein [Prevotella sp.]
MGTVITALVLLVVIALIIANMIKDKKSGKSSCGCGCEHCPNSSACHGNTQK